MDIKFKYSHVYQTTLSPKAELIPIKKIEASTAFMDAFWKSFGPSIEEILKEITGLSFTEKEITCYLVSDQTFSDPLTLKIENIEDMQDNLVHELMHVFLSGNQIGKTDGWKALFERFDGEFNATKIHLTIHSLHLLITQKLFPDRIKDIKSYSVWPAYVKSWEIVEEEGAENIIKSVFNESK